MENLGEYVLAHMQVENGTEFIVKLDKLPAHSGDGRLSFTADEALIHQFDQSSGKCITAEGYS